MLADPLPPLAGRIEVLVAEATLYDPRAYDGPTIYRILTVWIAVDPSESERRQARALAATFMAARCTFLQPDDTEDWFAKVEPGVKIDHVCMVLALPDHDAEADTQLRAMLDAVRKTCPEWGSIFVGVSTRSLDWAALPLSGHVRADQPAHQALHVFSMLAALMAPGMMCALDISDLEFVFGTASEPSRLAHVSCFPGDGGELLMRAEVKSMLENARQIAFMYPGHISGEQRAAIATKMRAAAPDHASVTLIAPAGLTVEQTDDFGSQVLFLLCTPTPGPISQSWCSGASR